MKILLAASEVAPIIKIGGLGDVLGSLPKALEKTGVNADVIVPYFPFANTEHLKIYKNMDLAVPFDDETHIVEVYKTKLPHSNVDVILLRNSKYMLNYGKIGLKSDVPELDTFSFFSRAVVEYVKSGFNTYDIIHCHDWHTGLVTHLLSDEIGLERPATLFTIHNLMYQGIGDPNVTKRLGIVPGSHALIDWDIADGDINLLQQGLTSSDYLNTVSPSYAKEILTPEYGGNLADILNARTGRLSGILNGLDYSQFPRNYNRDSRKKGKAQNKKALCEKIGLDTTKDRPIFSYIGRLDPYQKGLDILADSISHIVSSGGAFVLLGDGEDKWKNRLNSLAAEPQNKGVASINTKFDLELANLIYGGSDFMVIPSKYEPCGLVQLIAMWYGTLPIVRSTGGLKDTVEDGKNGIVFELYSAKELQFAIDKAINIYKSNYDELSDYAMSCDYSWDKSAIEYKKLYEKIVNLTYE